MKRWIRWGLILLAAGCLLAMGIYLYAALSEPYRFSEQWARQSAEVREKIGEVKRTHLSFSGVFSDEFKGDVREARVSTVVEGEKGSVIASMWLEKRGDDPWVVVRFRFDPT